MMIFVVPTSYPNEMNPIANSFIREQVAALSKLNGNIVVLNVRKLPSKQIFDHVDGRIGQENDGVSDILFKKQKNFLERFFVRTNHYFFCKSMKKVYEEAVKIYGKPDVIYAHFLDAGYAMLKITKGQNIPIVVLEHSGLLMSEKLDFRVKQMLKRTVEESREYIVTTKELGRYTKKHTGTKKDLPIIPNMLSDVFYYRDPVQKDHFEFFSVSRFDYDKRLDLLIDSFCAAFDKGDPVILKIGGFGKEYLALEEQIRKAGRQKQIHLLGRLDRAEVAARMAESDAFVLPSRHETFGLVWREALAVGRPVITTDHGGFGAEDWSNSYGIMIPVDDGEALADALKRLRLNYRDYDLKRISKENTDMYSSEKIAGRIFEVLKKRAGKENE